MAYARLVLLISLGVAGTAVALPSRMARGEPAEAAAVDAKAQHDSGTRAYNLDQFDRAIAAFTGAYQRDRAPILPFNIAQSHWKKAAAPFYRRPWLWAAVAGVVVGTAAVVLATRPGPAERSNCGSPCALGIQIVKDQ